MAKYPDKGIEKRNSIALFCFDNTIIEFIDKIHSDNKAIFFI